jgi:hypothetical protein
VGTSDRYRESSPVGKQRGSNEPKKLTRAVEAWFKPELLNGLPKINTETGERTNPEEFRNDFTEHYEILQFFSHIESGFITMTVSEYHNLPNFVSEAWNVYKNVKQQLKMNNGQ